VHRTQPRDSREAGLKKAVLFDLDGVLLESMPFHISAWQTVLSPFDISIKPDDIYSREGTRTVELARILLDHYGVSLPDSQINQIIKDKSETYNQISKATIMPGTEELLAELKTRQVVCAIVTSSFRENLYKMLPRHVLAHFTVLVTGGDVKQGKPHPEPYLRAARELKLSPSECVVIENAWLGVKSAQGAGMPCVAITSTQSPELLHEADMISADLSGILQNLDHILSLKGGNNRTSD